MAAFTVATTSRLLQYYAASCRRRGAAGPVTACASGHGRRGPTDPSFAGADPGFAASARVGSFAHPLVDDRYLSGVAQHQGDSHRSHEHSVAPGFGGIA